MKKLIRSLIIILPILLLGIVIAFINFSSNKLSQAQKETIKLMGDSEQFVISFIPRGSEDKPELVRSEIWLYPSLGKKVSFLAGNLAYSENYQTDYTDTNTTTLKPWDFDFYLNYEDVVNLLDDKNVTTLDLPGFEEQGEYTTYFSPQALFVIEQGQLSYFQTLEASADIAEILPTDLPTIEPTISNLKNYSSSDMGFSIDYPADWFLEYGVLSSYDTNYMEQGLELPDSPLKCDFNSYNTGDVEISNPQTIFQENITILQGKIKDNSATDGPGMGDGEMFVIKDGKHPDMALICFAYHPDYQGKLLEMLKSFSFLE